FRAVSGFAFAWLNIKSAHEAFQNGDNDHGYALALASAGEATSATVSIYAAFWGAATFVPWTLAVAGVVTAGAYIAAALLKDDSALEIFLTNCDWGVDPYSRGSDQPKWSPRSIASWKSDYIYQQQFLAKLLARVQVSWIHYGIEEAGVRIEAGWLFPDIHIEVQYLGRYSEE